MKQPIVKRIERKWTTRVSFHGGSEVCGIRLYIAVFGSVRDYSCSHLVTDKNGNIRSLGLKDISRDHALKILRGSPV